MIPAFTKCKTYFLSFKNEINSSENIIECLLNLMFFLKSRHLIFFLSQKKFKGALTHVIQTFAAFAMFPNHTI